MKLFRRLVEFRTRKAQGVEVEVAERYGPAEEVSGDDDICGGVSYGGVYGVGDVPDGDAGE